MDLKEGIEKALSEDFNKKRRFTQTVEIIFGFKNIDFKKEVDKRINTEVVLPKGRGKRVSVLVFGEKQFALDAKNAGADRVMGKADIEEAAKDKSKLKEILKYDKTLSQPDLMPVVAKFLGKKLSGKNKMPKPIFPNQDLKEIIEKTRNSVVLKMKGKMLATIAAPIGTEDMKTEDLYENAKAIYNVILDIIGKENIKSVYIKTTMGKPIRVM